MLFQNIDHLVKVIYNHGKYVFCDITIMDDMLYFIVKNFVKRRHNVKDNATNDSLINEFIFLYEANFGNRKISIPDKSMRLIGSGSYGIVYAHNDDDKLIKYATAGERKVLLDSKDNKSIFSAIMTEFCTFVITMSTILFYDCENIKINGHSVSSNKNMTFEEKNIFVKKYQDSYSSFFAELCKPFINTISETKNGKRIDKFIVGYIMIRYDDTLRKVFEMTTQNNISESYHLFVKAVNVFELLYLLNDHGILFSHRDNTTNNIMYTVQDGNKKIKLIDFGFMCINIKFNDGSNSAIIGSHTYGSKYDLDKCNKKYIDIILFLSWIVTAEKNFLTILDVVTKNKWDIKTSLCKIMSLNNDHIFKTSAKSNDPWSFSASVLNNSNKTSLIDLTMSALPQDSEKYTEWIFYELYKFLNYVFIDVHYPNAETYILSKKYQRK